MALPAGRYGVTKAQLLKIKKLPMNTIKLIEELIEKYNSLGTAATKNSTTTITADSTELPTGGAVFEALVDTVGWVSGELFNRDTCTEGYSISETGVITESSPFMYSDLIKVVKDGTYLLNFTDSLTFSHNIRVHEYDANGDWIRQNKTLNVSSAGIYTLDFKTSSDAVYVRISIPKTATNISLYHESVADSLEQKADNSVIAPIENGTNASQAYAVGEHFIRDGAFCTVTTAISENERLVGSSKFTSGDVASELRHYLFNSTSNLSFEVNSGRNYIVYTQGGSNNEYSFVWLVCVNNSGNITFIPLVTGTASTVSISSSGNTVTVTCSKTTIQMGYALL